MVLAGVLCLVASAEVSSIEEEDEEEDSDESPSSDMAEEECRIPSSPAAVRGLLECSRVGLERTSIWLRSSELWEFKQRICSWREEI